MFVAPLDILSTPSSVFLRSVLSDPCFSQNLFTRLRSKAPRSMTIYHPSSCLKVATFIIRRFHQTRECLILRDDLSTDSQGGHFTNTIS